MFKTLSIQTGLLSSLQIAARVLAFIFFILIARSVSPVDFGIITFFLALAILTTILSDIGLVQWYQRQHATSGKHVFNLLVKTRSWSLLFSLIVLSLLFLWRLFSPLWLLIPLLLILTTEAFTSISDAYYLSEKRAWILGLKQFSKSLIPLLLLSSGFWGITAQSVVWWVVIASILTWFWYFPWSVLKKSESSSVSVFTVLKETKVYAMLTGTSTLYSRGDSVLIQQLLGSAALGFYGLGYRFFEAAGIIPSTVSQILFHQAAKRHGITVTVLVPMVILMGTLGILTALLTGFALPELLPSLVSDSYNSAVLVIQVLSLALVLLFINAPLSAVIQSSNLVNRFLPWGMANTAFNLLINIILLPRYGVIAAAWAMVFTEFTGLVINVYFVVEKFRKHK